MRALEFLTAIDIIDRSVSAGRQTNCIISLQQKCQEKCFQPEEKCMQQKMALTRHYMASICVRIRGNQILLHSVIVHLTAKTDLNWCDFFASFILFFEASAICVVTQEQNQYRQYRLTAMQLLYSQLHCASWALHCHSMCERIANAQWNLCQDLWIK